jgi:hypothetical protein
MASQVQPGSIKPKSINSSIGRVLGVALFVNFDNLSNFSDCAKFDENDIHNPVEQEPIQIPHDYE